MEQIEHRHTYQPAPGGVDVKVSHTTTGVSIEVDVTRPRQEGETFEQAAAMSAALAASAYRMACLELTREGVTVGPFPKSAK